MKSTIVFDCPLSFGFSYRSSHVKDEIGIDTLARRIRDRHAEVWWHLRRGRGGRGGDGFNGGVDELAFHVLYLTVTGLGLQRVNQLHVPNRARRLGDKSGDALVALTTDTGRPVWRSPDADLRFPFR